MEGRESFWDSRKSHTASWKDGGCRDRKREFFISYDSLRTHSVSGLWTWESEGQVWSFPNDNRFKGKLLIRKLIIMKEVYAWTEVVSNKSLHRMPKVESVATSELLKPCLGVLRWMALASEISWLPSVIDPKITLMIFGSLYIIVASALFQVSLLEVGIDWLPRFGLKHKFLLALSLIAPIQI